MDPTDFAPVGVFPRQVIEFHHDLQTELFSGIGCKLLIDQTTNESIIRLDENYPQTWKPSEAINPLNFDRQVKAPSVLCRSLDKRFWYITLVETAAAWALGDIVELVAVTEHRRRNNVHTIQVEQTQLEIDCGRPRPRNQFILYRQWMAQKLRKENPHFTAGMLSQLIAVLWKAETQEMKDLFKQLADTEAELYAQPGFFSESPRVLRKVRGVMDPGPFHPWGKQNLPHNPMGVADRLIAEGH
ncbi:hypothetical protein B0T19DRAFT_57345 [Cercophora scortea]|uniref:HMG box domain-containing protein n=1 Tax=Cercophora scortea TaxID=314031 RepID=A0AAE0J5L2_9PEZI|nr:hypothetical protein B0T19DRAFT_57345 [Cercophora scortea]